MPENRGNAVAYAGATGHRPLPRAEEKTYRAAHKPQTSKSSGFNWDWNKATCDGCQTKTPKPHLVDGRCPGCRGEQLASPPPAARELEHSKGGDQVYETYDDTDLETRFTAPTDPAPAEQHAELPAHDGTHLGRALAELEATDPAVAAAAESLDHFLDQVSRPDDHVRPENLEISPADQRTIDEAAHRAEDLLQAAKHPAGRLNADELTDLSITHASDVLRRALAITTDPIVGMLRSAVLTQVAALDIYLQTHPQTPAAPAPSPRAPAPRAQTTEPSSPGARRDQPAADSEGEAEQQPATSGTPRRRPSRLDPHREELIAAYLAGTAASRLAKTYGISDVSIRKFLQHEGIALRTQSQAQQNRLTTTSGGTTA